MFFLIAAKHGKNGKYWKNPQDHARAEWQFRHLRLGTVFIATAAVHVEFTHTISPEEARQILSNSPGVRVLDDTTVSLYRSLAVAGTNDCYSEVTPGYLA